MNREMGLITKAENLNAQSDMDGFTEDSKYF